MCLDNEEWNFAAVTAFVAELQARFAQNPPPQGQGMEAWIHELEVLPSYWRGLALICANTGFNFGVNVEEIEKRNYKRESTLCGISVLFIIVGAILVFVFPNLNEQQIMIVCFLCSLGAAGFLVFLPGFLSLSGAIKPRVWLESLQFKAGGGAAIFILVFVILQHSLARGAIH
jgi:hypothetical protein